MADSSDQTSPLLHEQSFEFESVLRLFDKRAMENPDALAVVCEEQSRSYGEIYSLSIEVARRIKSSHKRSDAEDVQLVPIICDRHVSLPAAFLGVLRSGAAYVPVDPYFPEDRVKLMLEDAGAKVCVVDQKFRSLAESSGLQVIVLDDLTAEEFLPSAESVEEDLFSHGSLAYAIYTSGSTGRPKGVKVHHGGLSNLIASFRQILDAGSETTSLSVTTVSFDIFGLELFLPLTCGATMVIATRVEALSGRTLEKLLQEQDVKLFQATPASFRLLLDDGWLGKGDLQMLVGGEALPQRLADELVSRGSHLFNVYGPTETSIWSTFYRVSAQAERISLGRGIAATQLYLVDSEMKEVPVGEIGELLIGGAGVALGYHCREELTLEKFIPSPFGEGRVYRTGDLCSRDDSGLYYFHGRSDHQVKIRGYRIELGDIESALSDVKEVREAAVVVIGDDEVKSLVAYVTPLEGIVLEAKSVLEVIRERLPGYMVPSSLSVLEEMPLTPNRKIDRKSLTATAVSAAEHSSTELLGAETDLHMVLLSAFAEVLGVRSLHVDDHFFESGGHSLSALGLAKLIGEKVDSDVDVAMVFEFPTVRSLATALSDQGRARSPVTAVSLQPGAEGRPLFCLSGIAIYMPLAAALRKRMPVDAIYIDREVELFYGTLSPSEVAGSFGDMAQLYMEAIVKRQPHGPYRLAGLSLGGAIALETARLLQERGEGVELVALFDTMLNGSARRVRSRWAIYQAKRALRDPSAFLGKLRSKMIAFGNRNSAVPKGDEETAEASEMEERRIREERGHQAMTIYQPRTYDGDVLYVQAGERDGHQYHDFATAGGFEPYVRGRLSVKIAPGDHTGILRPPHVSHVAEAIGSALDS